MMKLRWMMILLTLTLWSPVVVAGQEVKTYSALSISGTPKYSADFTHFDYANPEAPKGGSVKFASIGTTYDSFNAYIAKGVPAAGITLIYDTLSTQSYDEPFSHYGLVSDKVEIPEDRSWIIYHLNPNARFHDGHPITAEDVVFTFNLLMKEGDPLYRKYYGDVEKVEAVDQQRAKFYLGNMLNPELALIIGQLPLLPKHFWEGKDFSKSSLDVPLGSGPYTVVDFKPGRSVTYKRVDDYWGRDLPVNKGRYNFDTITYEYYRDGTVALQAFKAGEFDFRNENSAKAWATEYTGPAFEEGYIVKEKIENDVNQGLQAFIFNIRRPLFQDRKVREAIGYAFDFEWTNAHLFYGLYERSPSYFSNSELAATGLPSKAELDILEPFRDQLPPEVFTKAYEPPKTDGSGNNRRQLRTAMKLLKEAGYEVKNKKLINSKTGQPFQFEILLHDPSFERVVLPFKQNLERLGIKMTVREVDTSQYINRMRSYDYDMIVGRFAQSESPGNEQREFWGSSAADLPGSRNLVGIKNPVVDQLIKKIISAHSREDLIIHCRALDRVLSWMYYVIPQWHTAYYRVAYWNMFSRPAVTPKYALDLFAWWVDLDQAAKVDQYRNTLRNEGTN